jgi:hypothetical protein
VYHRGVAGSQRTDERDVRTAMVDRVPAPVTGRPGTPIHVRRVMPSRVKLRVGSHSEVTRTRGMWLVVVAYLAAGAALGLAIYRFAG